MSEPAKPSRTPLPAGTDTRTPVLRNLEAQSSTGAANPSDIPTVAGTLQLVMPESLVGQTFGDFELTHELGRGGMGRVYKAWQKSLERPVALKLLLAEHTGNQKLLTRFLAEARAAASLTHPNIVAVYQVGECLAGPYFVMEFIDGASLEQLMKRSVPVSWAVSLMITVAEAVQHAHEKSIIHRDLKPANIMLHQSKRPVVMDFGIAKILGTTAGTTQVGTVVGTPAYMPPEQAGDDPIKIGPHSDVYSLGAILYTLLTGKPPFDEGNVLKTILRVLSAHMPESIKKLRPEVPSRLEQICMKCMQKSCDDRYQTAQALADDLKRIRASLAGGKAAQSSVRASLPSLLLIGSGGKQLRVFNPLTVIGRSTECDLVVKASQVSKRHCRILLTSDQVVVEDLGSSNGTFVNGARIDRAHLQDGDELDIGGHVYEVRLKKPGKK